MASTFNCPSCGVSLDNPETAGTMHCPYCYASIVIPQDFQQQPAEDDDDLDEEELLQIQEDQTLEEDNEFEEFISLVTAGNDFEAIVNYQKITGCDLAEAKEAVYNLRLGHPIQARQMRHGVFPQTNAGPAVPPEQVAEMKRLLQTDQKMEAIKIYRKYTSCSLRDARDAVEALERGEPLPQAMSIPAGKKGGACSVAALFNLFLGVVLLGCILALVYSSLPEDLRIAIGDYTGRFSDGYGYITLRIDKQGAGPGMLGDAYTATADSAGNIYVGDLTGGRIQVFNPDGKFIHLWNIEDAAARIDGLEVDRQGVVYALYGNAIYRYNATTGNPLGKITFPTQQGQADFSVINKIALAPDGNLVLTSGRDVMAISPKTKKVVLLDRPLQKAAEGTGEHLSVAVDGKGVFYILDEATSMVYKFSAKGVYISRFGGEGDLAGQFSRPMAIAVDNQNRVFVGDTNRIQAFDTEGKVLGEMWVDGVAHQIRFDGQNRLLAMVGGDFHVLRYTLKR